MKPEFFVFKLENVKHFLNLKWAKLTSNKDKKINKKGKLRNQKISSDLDNTNISAI